MKKQILNAFTPDGYRGALQFWYKTLGSSSPIMDNSVPCPTKEQCIYNVISQVRNLKG